MSDQNLKEQQSEIKDLVPSMGYCKASNTIMVDGLKVGFMYREEPDDNNDSGWRFLSGTENQKYVDDDRNHQKLEINIVANIDPAIVAYLDRPFGTDLERVAGKDLFQIL